MELLDTVCPFSVVEHLRLIENCVIRSGGGEEEGFNGCLGLGCDVIGKRMLLFT